MQDPPYRVKNMMPGMIMLWYGSLATIPSGWHACDGTMGTPNLANRFVRNPGPGNAQGSVSGSVSHSHPFTGDGHSHDLLEGTYILQSDPDGQFDHMTSTIPATGDTDTANHLPSYHSLYYIMKL